MRRAEGTPYAEALAAVADVLLERSALQHRRQERIGDLSGRSPNASNCCAPWPTARARRGARRTVPASTGVANPRSRPCSASTVDRQAPSSADPRHGDGREAVRPGGDPPAAARCSTVTWRPPPRSRRMARCRLTTIRPCWRSPPARRPGHAALQQAPAPGAALARRPHTVPYVGLVRARTAPGRRAWLCRSRPLEGAPGPRTRRKASDSLDKLPPDVGRIALIAKREFAAVRRATFWVALFKPVMALGPALASTCPTALGRRAPPCSRCSNRPRSCASCWSMLVAGLVTTLVRSRRSFANVPAACWTSWPASPTELILGRAIGGRSDRRRPASRCSARHRRLGHAFPRHPGRLPGASAGRRGGSLAAASPPLPAAASPSTEP